MRPLTIGDEPMAVRALLDEIRRTDESRNDHRRYADLLVAEGMTCRQAASVPGDTPRALEYRVQGGSSAAGWLDRKKEVALSDYDPGLRTN